VTRIVMIGSQGGTAASTNANWVPLASGAEPITWISDSNGNPIMTWFAA
jgi:hypothetical protein